MLAGYFQLPSDEREAFVTFSRSGRITLPAGANASDDSTHSFRAPWRRAYKHRTNLPAPLTPLIGRGQEVDTLRELIAHPKSRLVTFAGAPGIGKTRLGNLDAARMHLEESLTIARQAEDLQRTAEALTNLSVVARLQGDPGEARAYLDEASVIHGQLGHKSGIIQVLIQLGFVARDENGFEEARSHFSEALSLLMELANKSFIADCLEGLAWLVGKGGSLERSARLFGAAERLREVAGVPLSQAERDYYDRFLAAARQQADMVRWDTAWAEGRAMTLDHAIADALEA